MYMSRGADCIHILKVNAHYLTSLLFPVHRHFFLVGDHPQCVGDAHVSARTGGAAVQTAGEGFVLLPVISTLCVPCR